MGASTRNGGMIWVNLTLGKGLGGSSLIAEEFDSERRPS